MLVQPYYCNYIYLMYLQSRFVPVRIYHSSLLSQLIIYLKSFSFLTNKLKTFRKKKILQQFQVVSIYSYISFSISLLRAMIV